MLNVAGNTGILTLVTHCSQTSGTRVMRIEYTSESNPHSYEARARLSDMQVTWCSGACVVRELLRHDLSMSPAWN